MITINPRGGRAPMAAVAVVVLALAAAACGGSSAGGSTSPPATTPPASGSTSAAPRFDAASFGGPIDNPYFPLVPGTVLVYRGTIDGEPAKDVFRVTGETRVVDGVTAVVIHDALFVTGRLHEVTDDWYAQDAAGNVWYLGEVTKELDKNGQVTSTAGSWETGVDGAEAGIFMPAVPAVGQSFRQEYYRGQAEDWFQILDLSASLSGPWGASAEAMQVQEWTPLEPDVLDHKFYVRGIGMVSEDSVKGGDEHLQLVAVTGP